MADPDGLITMIFSIFSMQILKKAAGTSSNIPHQPALLQNIQQVLAQEDNLKVADVEAAIQVPVLLIRATWGLALPTRMRKLTFVHA